MRFKLSVVDDSPEVKVGGFIDYETAKDLPFSQTERINSVLVGEGKYKFNTGFLKEPILKNKYLSQPEKDVLIKAQQKAATRFVTELLGDPKGVINHHDKYLWTQDEYSTLEITNDISNIVFDTETLSSLILYWQIMCDAFGLVGVNLDHAISKQAPYFLQEIKDADMRENREDLDQVRAMSIIGNYLEDADQESLLYLSWNLGNRNDNMLGFNRSTSIGTLVRALVSFIKGDTRRTNKKQAVVEFVKANAELKANKDEFVIRVVIRVADFYGSISTNKDNIYVTEDGTQLGRSLEDCVTMLSKVSNRELFDQIYAGAMQFMSNDI